MTQRAWNFSNFADAADFQDVGSPTASLKESDESKPVFPFLTTPSGNLKVVPNQVVFESTKLSVLVANPDRTKVNVKSEVEHVAESSKSLINRLEGLHSIPRYNNFEHIFNKCIEQDEEECEQHRPVEFYLESLDIASKPLDWNKIPNLQKSDVMKFIVNRITNNINPDCTVQIGQNVFKCHLLVLQCYSTYFDNLQDTKHVELSEANITASAFITVYGWMIYTGIESYQLLNRDNILEVFVAAQFLGIKELEEHCWAFFNSDELFSEETAFHLYQQAKKMGNKSIEDLMLPRIMRFFLVLVSSNNFLDLSVEDLCSFLTSSFIAVHSEIEIFMSAVRWLMHDWAKRKEHLSRVMSCVRFGLISPWQLVDIRRNPGNPEFLEIISYSDVTNLIEDGLAYAIIKHWYGLETQEYFHWINLLALEEPKLRIWIGEEKTIILFKDFLRDLESYRKPQSLLNVPIRTTETYDPMQQQQLPALRPNESSPFSAFAQLMGSDYLDKNIPKQILCEDKIQSNAEKRETNNVVTLYQARVPDYTNLGLRSNTTKPLQDHVSSVLECESSGNVCSEISETVGSKNNQDAIIQSSSNGHKSQSVSLKHETYSTKLPSQQTLALTNIEGLKNQRQEITNENVVPVSHGIPEKKPPLRHVQQMSVGILGPLNKNYLAEGSLFFADREAVLVFGGVDPHTQYGVSRNFGKDIYRYQPDSNIWEFVGELPEPRHHHSVAFLKGRVFLVGGADPRDDDVRGKSVVVSTVWSYEPVTRSWYSESGMQTPRKNFGLVVSNGKLYAIGGQDRLGHVLSSVECFDPMTGIWEEMASLSIGRMGVAATKFQDVIWVAGGMTSCKQTPLCQLVECYDTRRNVWYPICSLRFPCCFARLHAMSDSLYLIGGAGRMTERDRTTSSLGVIDVWDDHAKEWRLLAELTIPRHGHSVAYLGTQLLIIGGVTTVYMHALRIVECFCCERGTWIKGICNLPTTLSGHGSVTLPPASLM